MDNERKDLEPDTDKIDKVSEEVAEKNESSEIKETSGVNAENINMETPKLIALSTLFAAYVFIASAILALIFATTGVKSAAASSSLLSGNTTFLASEPDSIGSFATLS